MVELIFSTDGNLASKVVEVATFSWCSHVSIVTGEGTVIEAVPSNGVQEIPVSQRLDQSERWELYRVDCNPEKVLEFARSQIGKPYDWMGIFGWVFRGSWEESGSWFCSELVAKSFKDASCNLINDRSFRVTPRDLLVSPKLVRIP